MDGLARQLIDTLCALNKCTPGIHHHISEARADANCVTQLRSCKEAQGVVVVSGAFTHAALAAAREAATAAWWTDVAPQISARDHPARSTPLYSLPWPTGIIGNASFGYLFAQPEETARMPRVTLSTGMSIQVAPGSGFKANIALVSHPDSQLAMALLYAVGGDPRAAISQDSCKIHRGALTVPHVDIYEDDEKQIRRMQAMAIGTNEGSVRLCYLRFSNHPDVKRLITDMLGVDIYDSRGFRAVPKDGGKDKVLLDCFAAAKCIAYGSPGDLVIWEPGVIHLEMKLLDNGSLVARADNKTTTERYIVGTQTPVGFAPREIEEVAVVSDSGFFFHPYNNANRGTPAGRNSVHRKRTQFKRPRPHSEDEKTRLAAVQASLADGEAVDRVIAAMDTRKRHCLGVSQPLDVLYDDPDARRIHGQ